jgi:uncharacterized membrane protein
VYHTIVVPGATSTEASGINLEGEIVGSFADSSFITHGFLLDRGNFTAIDVPGSSVTEAAGINPRGDIVGTFIDGGIHGFVLRRTSYPGEL